MADKLTTSKTLSGEKDDSEPVKGSQAAIEVADALAGGVGDATDWNHVEGEADPLVNPNAEADAAWEKEQAAAKKAEDKAAAEAATAEAKQAAAVAKAGGNT